MTTAQPHYQSKDATLYHGDALEILPSLGVCCDLVFCSPPYEAARTYGIDFALRGQEWVDWSVPRFRAGLSACRGLVAWVIEGQTKQFRYSAAPILFMADLHRAGVHLRKPPAYQRVGIPGSGGPDWLRNDYEFIVCGTNGGKLPWSENTAMGHKPRWGPGGDMSSRLTSGARVNQWGKNGTPRGMGNKKLDGTVDDSPRPSHVFGNQPSEACGREGYKKTYFNGKGHPGMRPPNGTKDGDLANARHVPFPAIANPGNVIKCKVGGGLMGSKLAHENEAPFPEKLAEFFIRSFCPPGGTVMDCFSGSGTTVATAVRLGRKAIGIDVRESQCDLSRRRIESVQRDLFTESGKK